MSHCYTYIQTLFISFLRLDRLQSRESVQSCEIAHLVDTLPPGRKEREKKKPLNIVFISRYRDENVPNLQACPVLSSMGV